MTEKNREVIIKAYINKFGEEAWNSNTAEEQEALIQLAWHTFLNLKAKGVL